MHDCLLADLLECGGRSIEEKEMSMMMMLTM